MKKSIFRWSAAVLVAASLGLALSGCGAKDKKTASSSAKASTSKVEKKAKSNSKKSAASSSQANDTASSSTQASSASASKDSGKTENASTQAPVPAELVGTWVGSSPQADAIKMTVDANGDVTTVVSFKNDSEPTRTATYTARAVQATGNIYYWDSEGLDGADALLPGITGLGVARFCLRRRPLYPDCFHSACQYRI